MELKISGFPQTLFQRLQKPGGSKSAKSKCQRLQRPMRHSKSSSQRLPEEIKLSLYKPTDSKARFQTQKKWESFLLAPLILYIRNSKLYRTSFLEGHHQHFSVRARHPPGRPSCSSAVAQCQPAGDATVASVPVQEGRGQGFLATTLPQGGDTTQPQLLRTDPPALLEKDDANKKAKKK